MDKSKVFFTDFHVSGDETLPKNLHLLMKRAGFILGDEIGLGTRQYELVKI